MSHNYTETIKTIYWCITKPTKALPLGVKAIAPEDLNMASLVKAYNASYEPSYAGNQHLDPNAFPLDNIRTLKLRGWLKS